MASVKGVKVSDMLSMTDIAPEVNTITFKDKDGYGLGLVRGETILSQHKEKITVTSENGVTSFSFTVQLAHPMRNT